MENSPEEGIMQVTRWIAWVAGVVVVVLSAAPGAQDPDRVVTFAAVADAVPGAFFDAATTQPDAGNPNRLIIGFNSGLDPTTFRETAFRASTAAFSNPSAMDTIRFTITAPTGYYIETVTYSQQGSGSTGGTGRAAGGANWVVGNHPETLAQFSTNPNISRTLDLTEERLTTVPVSVTNSLFVFSTPQLGSASVGVTFADVIVTVQPCSLDGRGNQGNGKGNGKVRECGATNGHGQSR
jgi:hypothetical protein